jgi:hypothetical protein
VEVNDTLVQNNIETLQDKKLFLDLQEVLKSNQEAKDNLSGVFSLIAKQEKKNLLSHKSN